MSGSSQWLLLSRSFYERDTVIVARALLGQRLVRVLDGQRLSGLICETEAYGGSQDEASHAFRRTPRSAIMFGPAGYAYVYFIYGMHFCLNAVTESEGQAGAVLIRAVLPDEGIATMRARRPGISDAALANGPGKLCLALGITRLSNGLDLTADGALFIESGTTVADHEVGITPRIGVHGDRDALTRPWRFVWGRAQPDVLGARDRG
jgi:DNA-3-methyladenine glycosylase